MLDDFAAAHEGLVLLNMARMETLPPAVRFWICHHESFHALNGPDETAADLFAIHRGVAEGWLDATGIEKVCAFIYPAEGDDEHEAGPVRASRMRAAFSAFASAAWRSLPCAYSLTLSGSPAARPQPTGQSSVNDVTYGGACLYIHSLAGMCSRAEVRLVTLNRIGLANLTCH